MIVSDTNLIAYLLIEGERTESARRAFQHDSEWCAPLLWISEFRNVLSMYLQKEIIEIEVAHEIMGNAEEIMAGNEYSVPSDPVLHRTNKSDRAAYDCEFVVLAEILDVPLVTADRELLSSFPDWTISIRDFSGS